MKYMIAAIYTNFTTSIVDDKEFRQDGGFVAGHEHNKLFLTFELV